MPEPLHLADVDFYGLIYALDGDMDEAVFTLRMAYDRESNSATHNWIMAAVADLNTPPPTFEEQYNDG